jgi:hypothetical protein
MTAKLIAPYGEIPIDCEPGQVSDGYHTFDELYEHRCLLWALVCNVDGSGFKTRKNDKGEEWPGWFIAGIDTDYGQITYHLPDRLWDLLTVPEFERNVGYDGHTAQDTLGRLEALLRDDAAWKSEL